MGNQRLKILTLARRALEQQGGSLEERENLLKLLDLLSLSIEKYSTEYTESTEHLVQGLFDNRALFSHRAMAAILGVILKLPPVKRAMASRQMQSRYLERLLARR